MSLTQRRKARKDLMQDQIEGYARESLSLAATIAADDAKLKLKDRFEQVKRMSNDANLRAELARWNGLANRSELVDQITMASSPSQLHALAEVVDRFAKADIEAETAAGRSNSSSTYSWFICDKDGYQIVRVPTKDTLGELFDFRSYFTGAMDDRQKSEVGAPIWPEDTKEPRLSASFSTLKGDDWVLAVSMPIQHGSEFHGVVGIFIARTEFVSIPGVSEPKDRFVAIYDARLDDKAARPIRHYALDDQEDLSTVDLSSLLEKGSGELTDAFDGGTWRAVAKPIEVAEEESGGLFVVVQERADLVVSPGEKLGANLIFLGLSVLGVGAAFLLPVWLAILKKVQ